MGERVKGIVIEVGKYDRKRKILSGFVFDCSNGASGIVCAIGRDGALVAETIAGYTEDELIKMAEEAN